MSHIDPSARGAVVSMDSLSRAEALASNQLGVIHLEEARACGLSDDQVYRLARAGRWIRMFPMAFRLSAAPASWEQRVFAATKWTGGIAWGRSAARLWELPGFLNEKAVEVTAPKRVRPREGVDVHLVAKLIPADRTKISSIPVASPARLLLSLAAQVDPTTLGTVMDDLLRRRLIRLDGVDRAIDRIGGERRSGIAAVRALLCERRGLGGPSHTESERQLFRILAASDLPTPIPQYKVFRDRKLIAQLDVAYPEAGVAGEADSYTYHETKTDRRHDRRRDRDAYMLFGLKVLRFDNEEIWEDEPFVVARFREELGYRLLAT